MPDQPCRHSMLFLGTHPDFRQGWLCEECHQFVDLETLAGYVVVLAAISEAIRAAMARKEK